MSSSIHDDDYEEGGCNWGFKEDAFDVDYESNRMAVATVKSIIEKGIDEEPTLNEQAYISNPLKMIQQWFENEGYDFEYKMDYSNNKFKCLLQLPIGGEDVEIEAAANLRKKDAINETCLIACKVLDKADILLPKQSQVQKRRDDGSDDSDSETMIDETESHTKKKSAKAAIEEALNYETLNQKWQQMSKDLQGLKSKMVAITLKLKKTATVEEKGNDDNRDSLDVFMRDLDEDEVGGGTMELKIQKKKILHEIANLEKEQKRVEKMIQIAKPKDEPGKVNVNSSKHIFKIPALKSQKISFAVSSLPSDTKKEDSEQKRKEEDDKLFKKPALIPKPTTYKRTLIASCFGEQEDTDIKDKKQKTYVMPKLEDDDNDIPIGGNLRDEEEDDDDLDDEDKFVFLRRRNRVKLNKDKSKYGLILRTEEETQVELKDHKSDKKEIKKEDLKSIIKMETNEESHQVPEIKKKEKTEPEEPKYGLIIRKKDPQKTIKKVNSVLVSNETAEEKEEEAYVEWTPPTNQKGDGMTSLNAKFGY